MFARFTRWSSDVLLFFYLFPAALLVDFPENAGKFILKPDILIVIIFMNSPVSLRSIWHVWSCCEIRRFSMFVLNSIISHRREKSGEIHHHAAFRVPEKALRRCARTRCSSFTSDQWQPVNRGRYCVCIYTIYMLQKKRHTIPRLVVISFIKKIKQSKRVRGAGQMSVNVGL